MSALKKPDLQTKRPLTPALSPKGARVKVAGRKDREKIFAELAHHRCRFMAVLAGDQDFILADLAAGVGQLAAQVTSNCTHPLKNQVGAVFNHRDILIRIAAHCVGWLDWMQGAEPRPGKDAFVLISAERDRQDSLFVEGNISFSCCSPVVDTKRKLRVLVEEVGEVAEAIDKLEYCHSSPATRHLIDELVQVAAVAVAWLETPECKS